MILAPVLKLKQQQHLLTIGIIKVGDYSVVVRANDLVILNVDTKENVII